MDLVFIQNNRVVTDSLTVAQVFGKDHRNVVRDIEVQIEKLSEAGEKEWGVLNFEQTQYQHSQNKQWYPKYELTEDAFAIVAMSYITPEAMKMKIRFINEFKRMKELLTNRSQPSYMVEDPIARAERWIEEQKEKRMLQQRVAEYEPKVEYVDRILQSKNSVTITQIAKDYGLSGQRLNEILHQEKVQYKMNDQWLLYSQHQDKGLTKSNTVEYRRTDGTTGVKMNTRWLQKGRLFIHDILKNRGIVPVIDRGHGESSSA
jgi:Rha family phage regulatory protein